MQVQVDIAFEQSVKIVKTLPTGKLMQLKAEIEKGKRKGKTDLKSLLLKGIIATKKQIETIENLSINGGQSNYSAIVHAL